MRKTLVIVAAISAASAALGAALTFVVVTFVGLGPVVSAVLAALVGLGAGLIGVVLAVLVPVPSVPTLKPSVAALKDLAGGRHDELKLADGDGPPELVRGIRELAVRLGADRRSAVTRESDLREAAARDAIAVKKLQEEVVNEEARGKSAIEVRDAFLARMSHELRTPLNAILGYTEMLQEEVTGEASTDLARVRSAATNLLAIVTSVLDLTQLQSNSFEVQPEPIRLEPLLIQVEEAVRLMAESNGVRIVRRCEGNADLRLDRRMLHSILFNLASNACKYTVNGTVTLAARTAGQDLVLEVSDTGIGMTERQIAEAFRPFKQADESSTRRYDGAGLGLAVVRGFAEAMGGTVAISSQPGKGASVIVTLPTRVERRDPNPFEEDEPTMLLR